MRAGNLFSNRGSAVLDAPEESRASKPLRAAGLKRSAPVTEMPLRRDAACDEGDFDDRTDMRQHARRSLRISFRDGLIPRSLWGKIAAVCALALIAAAAIATALDARSFLLHDVRFVIPSPAAVQVAGASHLTHAQLLTVFGEDVGDNIFTIPLAVRRAELERLPWVEHASVMRLLPNHLRVDIVERTPIAFVRQGAHIGLVDASGALFSLPSPEMVAASGGAAPHYSFPVLSGISAEDPLSTRATRMKLYLAFIAALDATGEKVSSHLSEVDLSDPDDVRAVIPDTGGSDILVHFGNDHFLDRYHAYRQHLADWRTQYPRLASVDMRYDQQVVLGMKPDATASSRPAATAAATPTPAAPPANAAIATPQPSARTASAKPSVPPAKPHARTAQKKKSLASRAAKHASPVIHRTPQAVTP